MRLAFILVIAPFNKFLSVMFVNKLENLSGKLSNDVILIDGKSI